MKCGILTAWNGPFSACHSAVPAHLYVQSCVYDQCATGGSLEQLCNDLEAYAAACAMAGITLGDWSMGTVCGNLPLLLGKACVLNLGLPYDGAG